MTSAVIPFGRYQRRSYVPPLVFIEMSQEHVNCGPNRTSEEASTLGKCRLLLSRARSEGWPVAFVTPSQRAGNVGQSGFRWIEGFRPQRSDMIFEPVAASCYSSMEFAGAMNDAGMHFVLAGFLGESVCLATLIDASLYGHHAGFIEDATSSRPLPGQDPVEGHRMVVATASRYATIVTAEHWLRIAESQQSALELCHGVH
jgi:nicotinamidase-related amidase